MSDLHLAARWILPIAAPPIEDAALNIVDGAITALGSRGEVVPPPGARRLDLGEAALLPGLVNVHAHLELTGLRGFLAGDDFFAWIRALTRSKYERFSEADLLASARLGVLEATAAGVTTVGEVCDLGLARDALLEAGLRGVLYQEVFGPDPAELAPSLERLESRLAGHAAALAKSDRLTLGVSPHAPYTVSAPLFEVVTDLALARGLPMTIHAAESRAEGAFLRRGEGPFAEFLRGRGIAWEPPGQSAVGWLDRLGVLRARPLLIHAIDLDPGDLELLAAQDVPLAHCPRSNAWFGHGVASFGDWRASGLRAGLGSDSVASSNSCDLFEEARLAALQLRQAAPEEGEMSFGPRQALRLLTLGGAEALGLADRIGSLEPGKRADLIAVDLSRAALQPVHDIESTLLWSASSRDVSLSLVEGELLYREGRFTRLDATGVLARARELPSRLRPAR